MTFTVEWHDSDGNQITEFDVMVPPELLAQFELLATSRTGKGNNETSATCTYPDGEPVLRCIYEGHGKSGSDALIIPAKQDARYTVSVAWPVTGWTVTGADPEQEYKARKTCGVESGGDHGTGGGHEPGSEPEAAGLEGNGDDSDGHGSGGQGSGGHGGGGVSCVHTVVMRQVASLPPAPSPPAPEPPAAPPTQESGVVPPAVTPPATPTAPEMQSLAATPRSLPATGGSVSVILLIGGVLITMGSALAGLTRRTS
jgi:LPXTG-motif cell wall-anchored protein